MSEEAQQEPTMEEILASIRRIISEEDEGDDAAAAPDAEAASDDSSDETPEQSSDESEEQAEILELTQKVDEDGALVDESAEPEAPEPEPEEVSEPEPEPEPETAEEPQSDIEPEQASTADEDVDDIVAVEPESVQLPDEALIGNVAAGAAAASFGDLARNIAIATSSSRTLEDMVLELLKPILKTWLDDHLPSMVEEMVREEITRVAKLGRTSL